MDNAAGARAEAARIVLAVARDGRSLDDALAAPRKDGTDSPTVQALSFGTIRWFHELEACLELLAGRKPEKLDPLVRAVALVGLFQLAHGRTPAHAAVAETVQATRLLRRPQASGLVNAVLRRFLREREAILAAAHRDPEALYAHPAWLIDAVRNDWPDKFEAILAAGNAHPPMWLRVNAMRVSRDAYAARLAEAGFEAAACGFAPQALKLSQPVDVRRLPGFEAGDVSVQDAAAQLAAQLLDVRSGMRVLDACAAPGGKACHILELRPDLGELVALDIDPRRMRRIRDNLDRLGLRAVLLVGDAATPAGWWDGRKFERILLDVPCSGTGVIRRHPDIKLLRRREDIEAFAHRQGALLAALWPLLAVDGRLVYASCSVLRAENAGVVGRFLAATPGAAEVTESARLFLPAVPPGTGHGPGFALPTGAADTDGFFYACLHKRA